MKGFLVGFSLLPAALGLLVIFHTFIDTKRDGQGGIITNRIARAELVWLAMNKPRLFCDRFEWVCQDVQDKHEQETTVREPEAQTTGPELPDRMLPESPEIQPAQQ